MYFESDYPRLCGGTFLTLLLQVKAINKQTGRLYPNSFVWKDLVSIFDNTFASFFNGRSAATTTSKYKSCESSNSGYLSLDYEININRMNQMVEDEYEACLNKMVEFINSHLILDEKNPWLIIALLDLLSLDKSIKNEDKFFATESGETITKQELMNVDNICVPAFIIGIWHFIINNRKDNLIGRNTFLKWTEDPTEKKAERPFISDIGKNSTYDILLDFKTNDTREIGSDSNIEEDNKSVVAPEITLDNAEHIYFVDRKLVEDEHNNPYEEYISNVTDKYSNIKTLLYNNEPKPFYSFFVCNNLRKKVYTSENESSYRYKIYRDITVDGLEILSKYIILTGTGGLGKSMMMRHLLLSALKKFGEGRKLPVFISLKEYSPEYDLLDFFYDKLIAMGFSFSEEIVRALALGGNFIFLLDGYDEIYSVDRASFDSAIGQFTDMYNKNTFIISSRPSFSFIALARYTVLELCPFTKDQAISLVNKLEFRPDDPDIKQNFLRAIHDRLYRTHQEFIGNPLLLTIMLMSFERFADIPSKMHVFYREAYETLSTKHDATKGAYKRRMCTGLNADDFEKYLAEFCARTYKEERFEFDDEDMKVAFGLLNEVKRNKPEFSYKEFTEDLTSNLCLFYQEGNEYHFTHRSFQEYFCALFFSRQKDKYLWEIGKFFNRRRSHSNTDQTFAMLYDMIADKVEEYIFLPFFERLFTKCDNEKGYWTFLNEIYPHIYYDHGDVASSFINRSNQYLYDFVMTYYNLRARAINENDLPYDERLVLRRYGSINNSWFDKEEPDDWETVDMEEIDELYIDLFGEPDEKGWNLQLDVEDVISEPNDWRDIIEAMEKDTFPLRQEYFVARRFFEELKKQIEDKQKNDSDELFDLF